MVIYPILIILCSCYKISGYRYSWSRVFLSELFIWISLLYPKVKITFVDKDAPLAIKLQEVLGAGTLEYPKNTRYVNLLLQDVNSLWNIAVLLNG